MVVGVDEGRHHRLARQVHPCGTGGHAHVGGRTRLYDVPAVDDHRRVLDRGAPVAHDEARAFIHRGRRRLCERRNGRFTKR